MDDEDESSINTAFSGDNFLSFISIYHQAEWKRLRLSCCSLSVNSIRRLLQIQPRQEHQHTKSTHYLI